jgi:hypothetical protein
MSSSNLPGEYFVAIVGEADNWTQQYGPLPRASAAIAGYLRQFYPGRTTKVVVDATEGRHVRIWNGRQWTKRLALLDMRSPDPR